MHADSPFVGKLDIATMVADDMAAKRGMVRILIQAELSWYTAQEGLGAKNGACGIMPMSVVKCVRNMDFWPHICFGIPDILNLIRENIHPLVLEQVGLPLLTGFAPRIALLGGASGSVELVDGPVASDTLTCRMCQFW